MFSYRAVVVCVCCILLTTLVCGVVEELKEFSCGFENDLCEWQIPEWSPYGWSRTKYKSLFPSSKNGPSATYDKGYYAYFNNTFLSPNSEAYLESVPIATKINRPCLRFYYHMFGSTMGSLEIGLVQDGVKKQLWQRSGDQLDTWHCGKTDLSSANPGDTIYIKAIKGPDVYTAMAVDSVQLFINVQSCEEADCDNLEDSLSVTDPLQIPTTTVTETQVPENKTLFENAFPAFMYQLQWTVGVPSGVIVFFLVLLIVVKAIDRQQLREQKRREAFSMQLLHEYKQSSGVQGGNPFFAVTIPGPLYCDTNESEENAHTKENGQTPSDSKTANGGGHIGETTKSNAENGQIVKCEINHHNIASSSTNIVNEPCSSRQLDDSEYVTLKE